MLMMNLGHEVLWHQQNIGSSRVKREALKHIMAEIRRKKGVRLDHISKIYKDPKTGKDFYAVKDVSLDIEPGSFVTLLGPSGCGKTTTLRMIAGFESPDEGEIYLGGEAINALTPNKRDTAMVFQSYALLPALQCIRQCGLRPEAAQGAQGRDHSSGSTGHSGAGGAVRHGSAHDQSAFRRPAAARGPGPGAGGGAGRAAV